MKALESLQHGKTLHIGISLFLFCDEISWNDERPGGGRKEQEIDPFPVVPA